MSASGTPLPPIPPPPPSASPQALPELRPKSPPTVRDRTPPKISGLSCPNCAAPLEVAPGLRVLVCGYCDTPLRVTGAPGIRRYSVAPAVDADQARQTVRKWLTSGWNKDRRLGAHAEIGEAFLCFLPFFRVEADAVGCALGTEVRKRGDKKKEVEVERQIEERLDRTYPAVQVAEWGVQKVDLTGDRLEPFDGGALERRGLVFPPTASELEIRDGALADFKREVDPRRKMKRVRFFWLETVHERLTVIYYPLWVVRYRFEDRAYQVLVDAEDGEMAYGKAPGNDVYRAATLVGSQMAAAFVVTTLLQMTGTGVLEAWEILGAVALFCLWILSWGWKRFRWGAEIVEGSGAPRDPDKGLGKIRHFFRHHGWGS